MGKSLRPDYEILEYKMKHQQEFLNGGTLPLTTSSPLSINEMKQQIVEVPFIKEPSSMKYTLVLDLDETLIHYSD